MLSWEGKTQHSNRHDTTYSLHLNKKKYSGSFLENRPEYETEYLHVIIYQGRGCSRAYWIWSQCKYGSRRVARRKASIASCWRFCRRCRRSRMNASWCLAQSLWKTLRPTICVWIHALFYADIFCRVEIWERRVSVYLCSDDTQHTNDG